MENAWLALFLDRTESMAHIPVNSTGSRRPIDRRLWIWGSLIGSGLLLIVTVFACLMQFLLASLGDELGARVAHTSVLVTGSAFLGGHILLVTLLALEALESNIGGASPTQGRSPS